MGHSESILKLLHVNMLAVDERYRRYEVNTERVERQELLDLSGVMI